MYGFSNLSWDSLAPFHLGDFAEVQVFQCVIIRRRNWSHGVKCFFDVVHRNSCFLAGWRTQTMRHLFFTALSFISVSEKLALSRYTAWDDTFCSCSSPPPDPRSCVPTRAGLCAEILPPKAVELPLCKHSKKSCEWHCRGETWAFTSPASSKSLPRAPSPGTDVPFPCLHQRPSILLKGAAPQLWLLLFVLRTKAWLQKLRHSKKVTADTWLGTFLVVLHRCTCGRIRQSLHKALGWVALCFF